MNRKGFCPAILMSLAALTVLFAFAGVPFAGGVFPIISGIVFSVSALLIFAAGFFFERPWKLVGAAGACILLNLLTSGLGEGLCAKPFMLALGWAMAMLFSISGIIMTVRSREEYRIILSIIFNSVMAFVSLCVFIAEFVAYKGLVVIPALTQNKT